MVRSKELSKEEVRGLIYNLFAEIKQEVEATAPYRLSDWEKDEQLYCSSEMTALARVQQATGSFGHQVQSIARRALSGSAIRFSDLSANSRDDLHDGAARLLIERERLYQLRLSDRLAPFAPSDAIFQPSHHISPVEPLLGPTLGAAIDRYLEAKRRSWTEKTYVIRTRYLGYLRQHFGDDQPLSGIQAQDVRAFRDAVIRLRRSSGRAVRQSFIEKQTNNKAQRISDSTITLIFEPTRAFFRWCFSDEGYLDRNPAENIRMAIAKRTKGKVARRPFSAGELTQLFSAPLFTGYQSPKRKFVPGACKVRDAYFWIPVLSYYSGARLGELVQLHMADIGQEDGIAFIRITEDGGGSAGGRDAKHVKSEAGVRQIPLHDDLIALGFLEFVEKRRSQRKGSKRLFGEVKFGADKQASTVFSKWFGRLMGRAGLNDPALVFHSFRHNAQDAYRDALQPQYVIDRIIGHNDGATSAGYGQGASLLTLKSAVDTMSLKVRLPTIWN